MTTEIPEEGWVSGALLRLGLVFSLVCGGSLGLINKPDDLCSFPNNPSSSLSESTPIKRWEKIGLNHMYAK